jgi:hypothetical protein
MLNLNTGIQISKYLIVASGRKWRKVLSTIPNELSTQQCFRNGLQAYYRFNIGLQAYYRLNNGLQAYNIFNIGL